MQIILQPDKLILRLLAVYRRPLILALLLVLIGVQLEAHERASIQNKNDHILGFIIMERDDKVIIVVFEFPLRVDLRVADLIVQIRVAVMIPCSDVQGSVFDILFLEILHDLVSVHVIIGIFDSVFVDIISYRQDKINSCLLCSLVHDIGHMIEVVLISSALVSQVTKVSDNKESLGIR